ncbi:MAG: AbgT family transporter [Phycisphaeraceae bacterium]|nr:MAG: AbgT family transporter [Phycisphaeraceae bacterium]
MSDTHKPAGETGVGTKKSGGGLLDAIEWAGNKLPDPTMLFLIGAIIVMVLSHIAYTLDWSVSDKTLREVVTEAVDEAGLPIIDAQSGEPYVIVERDAAGEPLRELVADGKRLRDAFQYVYDEEGEFIFDDTSQPLARKLFDESGEPFKVLTADRQRLRQAWRQLRDEEGEPLKDDAGRPIVEPMLGDDGLPLWVVVDEGFVDVQGVRQAVADGEPVFERAVDAETGEEMQKAVYEPVADGRDPVTFLSEAPRVTEVKAKSLLTRDGFYWAMRSMVDNFMAFPPLGVVLVGMLGIGVAERTGLIGAALKAFMLVVPSKLLTPSMVFLGAMSSLGMDAGYVVLPPLAALLYKAVGRSPLVGIAAVFAGVSAGFNSNLLVTGLDPMLAGFTQLGANVIDPDYRVAPTCNWFFLIASTFMVTAVGWMTTSWIVEKRLNKRPSDDGGPAPVSKDDMMTQRLSGEEIRGLKAATVAFFALQAVIISLIFIPGAALQGKGDQFDRWVDVIVPIIFFSFVTPGIAYGVALKAIRNGKDVARYMIEAMAAMAPIIVLAFFAAQFIEYFNYSNLGRMLAMAGGQFLATADMNPAMLMIAFILVTLVFNLFVGSMSAKYALFAPIFVPMFMLVGISPELTQAAYRIGDSVSNIITPLNAYLVIILVFMQKYAPKSGMGTLVSMMLPYTITFTIAWCILLIIWMQLGIPLGIEGPLTYAPE